MKVRTLAFGLTKIEAANRVKRYFHTYVSLAASVEIYLMVKPAGGFLCN